MVRVLLLVKGYVRTAEAQGQCERQLYRQQRSVMPGGPGAVREATQVALAAWVQGEHTGRSREQGAHGALKAPRAAW